MDKKFSKNNNNNINTKGFYTTNFLKFKENFKKNEIKYGPLLDRLLKLLKVHRSNSEINQKLIICPPIIKRDGPKKTIFIKILFSRVNTPTTKISRRF